eukprot:COSAG02_NODE_24248_length_693_cov_8.063973_1_plen_91_part_00
MEDEEAVDHQGYGPHRSSFDCQFDVKRIFAKAGALDAFAINAHFNMQSSRHAPTRAPPRARARDDAAREAIGARARGAAPRRARTPARAG